MPEDPDARPHRRTGMVVAAVVALALAGLVAIAAVLDLGPFGEDSGELTKAEFVARADGICKDAHDQFASLQPSPPNTAAEAAVLTGKLLSISESEFNRIDGLDAPAEVRPALNRYLEARMQGIDLIRNAYEAAKADDPKAYYRDLLDVSRTQVRRLQLARDVGLTECSKPIAALDVGAQQ